MPSLDQDFLFLVSDFMPGKVTRNSVFFGFRFFPNSGRNLILILTIVYSNFTVIPFYVFFQNSVFSWYFIEFEYVYKIHSTSTVYFT